MYSDLSQLFTIFGVIISFSLTLILVINFMKFPPKILEPLSNNDYVVLIGDSILKNDMYVDMGDSVGEQLQIRHGNVIILAEDGAIIKDLERQFKLIPNKAKSKNTKIIISVGGNDLLNHYTFNDTANLSYVDSLFNKYTSAINNMKNDSNSEIVLCNIYYPRSKSIVRFYDIIELWNSKVKTYASNNGFVLINLDDKVDKKHHFTNDIEPSKSGSKVICNSILAL